VAADQHQAVGQLDAVAMRGLSDLDGAVTPDADRAVALVEQSQDRPVSATSAEVGTRCIYLRSGPRV
jgi:hypothetical protein